MMTRMKEHGKLSERQFAGIIANTMVGVGVLILPKTATKFAGTAGWIALLLGGVIALFFLFLILKLGTRFPENTLMEYAPRIIGKIPGTLVSLIFCTYWFLLSSLIFRVFAEMMVDAILLNTPIEVIIISMLILVAYLSRHDVEVFGRVNELFFIFLIIPAVFGLAVSLKQVTGIKLLPLLGNGLPSILINTRELFFSFVGFEIIFLFIPSITTLGKVYNYGFKGWLSPAAIYLAVVIIGIGVFGTRELQNLMWPTLELVKVINFPGLILERVEAIFIAFWVIAVFTTVTNLFYSSVVGATQVLKLSDHKTLVYPLLPLFYFFSTYPQNIYEVLNYMNVMGKFGGLVIITVTPLLYIISLIRNIKGGQKA
ncbi:GerAB/ArcD/ProY family transporter [Halothermothrix orenii]|nr:endospore germination permease [Halothermothrix orenii]